MISRRISELVRLATEAKNTYQTLHTDRSTNTMLLIQKRDEMESRLLDLLEYMEKHWHKVAKKLEHMYDDMENK